MSAPRRLVALLLCVGPRALSGLSASGVNDPRGAVLGTLFGDQVSRFKFWGAGYTKRKVTVLRWRVAQQRSMVERAAREIGALEGKLQTSAETLSKQEELAFGARISTLRREAGVAESKILLLKTKLGKVVGKVSSHAALREGTALSPFFRRLGRSTGPPPLTLHARFSLLSPLPAHALV